MTAALQSTLVGTTLQWDAEYFTTNDAMTTTHWCQDYFTIMQPCRELNPLTTFRTRLCHDYFTTHRLCNPSTPKLLYNSPILVLRHNPPISWQTKWRNMHNHSQFKGDLRRTNRSVRKENTSLGGFGGKQGLCTRHGVSVVAIFVSTLSLSLSLCVHAVFVTWSKRARREWHWGEGDLHKARQALFFLDTRSQVDDHGWCNEKGRDSPRLPKVQREHKETLLLLFSCFFNASLAMDKVSCAVDLHLFELSVYASVRVCVCARACA